MKRKEIKRTADDRLTGFYGLTFLVSVFSILFVLGAAIALPVAGAVLIVGPIRCGVANMYRKIAIQKYRGLDDFFDGFKNFGTAIGAHFWKVFLMVCFSVLFGGAMFGVTFIPSYLAVIAAECVLAILLCVILFVLYIVHRFTYFVISEDDTLTELQCYKQSRKLVKGNFRKLVVFELSYLLWRLGVILTLGILYHRYNPKYKTALALLYELIKKEKGYFPAKEEPLELCAQSENGGYNSETVTITKTSRKKTITSSSSASSASYAADAPAAATFTADRYTVSASSEGTQESEKVQKEDQFDIDAFLNSLHETSQKSASFKTVDNFDITAAAKQSKSEPKNEKTEEVSQTKNVGSTESKAEEIKQSGKQNEARSPFNPYGKEPARIAPKAETEIAPAPQDSAQTNNSFDPYNVDLPDEE